MIEIHTTLIQISWRSCQKVGKIWYCCIVVGRSLKIGRLNQSWWRWMNCLEANYQGILKQKIEIQLYSTASTWSLEDWRGGYGDLLLLYFTRWVKYCIDRRRVHTKCYMLSVSVARLLNKWFLEMLQIKIWKTYSIISKCYKKKFLIPIFSYSSISVYFVLSSKL